MDDLNRGLAWAGPGFYEQALAGSHGPWLDVYVRGLGPDIARRRCATSSTPTGELPRDARVRRSARVGPLVALAAPRLGRRRLRARRWRRRQLRGHRLLRRGPSSLYERRQVRVLGLPAGTVDRDRHVEGDRVRGRARHRRRRARAPATSAAALIPQSLIGERYVQLMPAWTEGQDRGSRTSPEAERVIDVDETIIPVEPDEALAALNEFLETLDPDGLGRLIDNSAEDLEGNGENLEPALDSDQRPGRHLRRARRRARLDRRQLRRVHRRRSSPARPRSARSSTRSPAPPTLLADERAEHRGARSPASPASARTASTSSPSTPRGCAPTSTPSPGSASRSSPTSTPSTQLLDSGPLLADGLIGAYNPEAAGDEPAVAARHRSRTSTVNVDAAVRSTATPASGLPCVPVTVACAGTGVPVAGAAGSEPVLDDSLAAARTPIDDVLDLLGAPAAPGRSPRRRTSGPVRRRASPNASSTAPAPSDGSCATRPRRLAGAG